MSPFSVLVSPFSVVGSPLSVFRFSLPVVAFPLSVIRSSVAAVASSVSVLRCRVVGHQFQFAVELGLGLARFLDQGGRRHQLDLIVFKLLGVFLVLVHLDDGLHVLGGDGIELVFAFVGIPHYATEYVGLLVHRQAFLEAYGRVGRGKLLEGVGIYGILEIEAAFQLAALACQLLRVGQYLLRLCHAGCHRLEVGQPGAAAQFAAAGAYAAHFAGFLSDADLLHLDADVELLGQHLDQVAEIHAVVGGVVEYRFRVVALVFDVVDLHHQSQLFGNLACFLERRLFLLDSRGPALDVADFGATEEFLDCLRLVVDFLLDHLDAAGLAGEADDAHVVARDALDGHHVAVADVDAVRQAEEFLAVVLETHLDAVEGLLHWTPYAVHPVAGPHFAAAAQLRLGDRHIAVGLVVASS